MSLAHLHRHFPLLIILSIVTVFTFKFFNNQAVFLKPYDPVKMRQIFDNSQWRVPNSKQGISDEELYQVAGYHIMTTGEMFEIAPEVPPLGKYFYGWTIMFFGNAYYMAFLLFLLSIVVFYSFTKLFIESVVWRLFAVLLYVSDPLLSVQAFQTMLDIPHLIALLIHMYAVIKIGRHKDTYSLWLILLAGISLGAFAGLKIGFFTVLVLFVDFLYLWLHKKFLNLIPIAALCGLIYPVLYLPFFLDNHNIIDFLKAQKWILHFYLMSEAKSLPGMPFISLFTGFIKGWDGRGWDRVKEWSVLWPFLGLSYFAVLYKLMRSKKILQQRDLFYLLLMIGILFFGFLLVPFFARYFTLVLPPLIICLVMTIQKLVTPVKKSV